MRITLVGVALAVCATGGLAEAKPEKPKTALKRVVKKLHRLKSYKVNAHVKGGEATGKDHRVSRATVDKAFSALVRGKVSKVDGRAYRRRLRGANGAIDVSGTWKKLLATQDGRLISRLFLRPEEHLSNALRYSKRAKWVGGAKTNAKAPVATSKGIDFESKADEGDASGTQARKKKTVKKSSAWKKQEITSNVIRIEAPARLAVKQFNTIVNSGCFSEG